MNMEQLTLEYWMITFVTIVIVYGVVFGLLHLMQHLGLREVTRAMHEQTRAMGMMINDRRADAAEHQALLRQMNERCARCEENYARLRQTLGTRQEANK